MRNPDMRHCWSACMFILVFSHSLIINNGQSLCHDHEELALLHFKQSFLIDCTASHSAFARPKVKSWRGSSRDDHEANGTSHTSGCCRWEGVKCNQETGHLIGLDLSSSCLYGTFPHNSTLFGLDHLRELDLSDNNFKFSQIPSAISQLTKLARLNLSLSSFSGKIPSGMSELSSLSVLDLSSNSILELKYDFSFENLVGNLTHLSQLHLDDVDISSVVPSGLSNLTSLQALYLENCNLYGIFPADALLLPRLEELSLRNNIDLGGYLPEFPPNRPLRLLSLKFTAFSGELTPSIGNLGSLTELSLGMTNFIGSIPSSLGNLTKLTILDFFMCNFIGDLPLPITNLTQLTILSLSGVNIRHQMLNSWLLKLTKLEHLALRKLSLSGEIPEVIANLTRLNWLDLGLNQFTGPLPPWLANLTELSYLDLQGYNHFQTPVIPQWFSQLINLNMLYLSSKGSTVKLETLLKLPNLISLVLNGVDLITPPNRGTNTSLAKLQILNLVSCNLTEFPQLLRFQDEIQFLSLSKNNIIGIIPQWFVNTTRESLLEIQLDDNLLTGFEEPHDFLPWSHLEVLQIHRNKLQGRLPIPPESLKVYAISQNQLSSVMPKQICKANSLAYLDVSGNNFSGQIPSCLGPLLNASLQVLNFRGNQFQGTIPQTLFSKACKLKMINLSENQLEGQLPKSLINCEVLEVLDVGKNCLNDTFPSWLGSLPKLQVLVLRHNIFHGTIANPKPGHYFSGLRVIDLSYNFHTGDLPAKYLQHWPAMRVTAEDQSDLTESNIEIQISVFDFMTVDYQYEITITNKGTETLFPEILKVFRVIDFSSNNFTGGIPDVLGKLKGLQALNVSNNHLVGGVPGSLANIIHLEALDLSQNRLSGQIPQQLAELTFLEIFNVSYNLLVGRIPQGEQFNTFDNSSFDGNLGLCGVPLSRKCEDTDFPQQPSPSRTHDENEQESMLVDWIIRSLGCASGCIVGFIIGKIYITDRHHDWFMKTCGRNTKLKPIARKPARRIRRN